MENATKLMLMAAGILITVLIVSIGVYNARRLDILTEVYQSRVDQLNVRKYNANFENFIDDDVDKSNITAQEIVSLINFVQNNESYTEIYVDGVKVSDYNEQEKNNFLKNNPYMYDITEVDGINKKTIQKTFFCPSDGAKYNDLGYIEEINFYKK